MFMTGLLGFICDIVFVWWLHAALQRPTMGEDEDQEANPPMSLRNSLLAVLAIAALGGGFAVSSAFRALFFRASAGIKQIIALAVLLVALALMSAAVTAACCGYEQPPFGLEAGLMLLTRRRLTHSIGAVKARKSSAACCAGSTMRSSTALEITAGSKASRSQKASKHWGHS